MTRINTWLSVALVALSGSAIACSAASSTSTASGGSGGGVGVGSGSGGAGVVASGGSTGSVGSGGAPGGIASGGIVGSTGSGGSGGAGTGGAATTTTGGTAPMGGTTAGTGGTTGAGGAVAGSGCPGIPLVPDAKGLVALGTNPLAIHGSWFEYSDCVDLKNVNCSMVTAPPANSFPNVGGKMCTSGHTSMAAAAWGAGIGLELNDGPPQMPYDTTAHGIKGFCFQLSGPTIPSTTLRVAFPTKNNNDNAYFSAVTTPGQHTVLFSDTAQGSWVTTKSAFEPNAVMLLQFQIPASPTAVVPWDFCIEGLTAITQ